MSDLRQRIEDVIMPEHVDPNAEAESYEVLAVFAAWLRERAEREHDPDCALGRRELQHYPGEKVCAHLDARCRRDFAIALADEIAALERP